MCNFFNSLDYAGIVLFIMGSFIPPLYYAFYCSRVLKTVYMSLTCTLGATCITVSLWSKFNKPKYRILRAGEKTGGGGGGGQERGMIPGERESGVGMVLLKCSVGCGVCFLKLVSVLRPQCATFPNHLEVAIQNSFSIF